MRLLSFLHVVPRRQYETLSSIAATTGGQAGIHSSVGAGRAHSRAVHHLSVARLHLRRNFARQTKSPARAGLFAFLKNGERENLPLLPRDYMSIPPIPPMPPWPWPACDSSFGVSATIAAVVRIKPATEAAFCRAERVTLVGSSTPIWIMSPYSPLCAL